MGNAQPTTNIGILGEVQADTYTSITTAKNTPGTANIAHVGNLLKVKEFALEVALAGDNQVDLDAIVSKFGIVNNSVENNSENGLLIQQKYYDTALQLLRDEGYGETMVDNFINNMKKAAQYRSVASTGSAAIRDVKNGTQVIVNKNGNQSVAVGGETLFDFSHNPTIYLEAGEEQEREGTGT